MSGLPKGFRAAGVRAGIKAQGEDLALIYSEVPASAAGVFTANIVKAAPVLVSRERVPGATGRAVIINSGNANACTGEQGMRDAVTMVAETARLLGVDERDVLVASTGIIGHAMPMDIVTAGIAKAVESLSPEGGELAARAIMTTDTRPKTASAEFELGGASVSIWGTAKGAGMICPNMATMLSFIVTDTAIEAQALQDCLRESAEISYNCLTIDGDTSTNDTVIMLANGAAGNAVVRSDSPELSKFRSMLDKVTTDLARQIASDGEGATKLVSVTVTGAPSYENCRIIGKTIANSPLVKTALFGCDPNWGRVLAAAGRSGIDFDPAAVELRLGETLLLQGGEPVRFSEKEAHDYLKGAEILVDLKVGSAPFSATVWTCDFSYDYVKINAEYHT